MKSIVITEVTLTNDEIPELLREIATMVEGGYTSGQYPTWYIEEIADPEEDAELIPA